MFTRTPRVVLRSISISHYRSIRAATFEPHSELSVLVGPNGSGKTNLLNAIQLLRLVSTARPHYESPANKTASPCSIRADFSFGDRKIGYRALIWLAPSAENRDEVVLSEEAWSIGSKSADQRWHLIPSFLLANRYGPRGYYVTTGRRDVFAQRRRQHQAKELSVNTRAAFAAVAEFTGSISYYSASRFTDPSRCPSSFETDNEGRPVESYNNRGPHFSFVGGLYVLSRINKNLYSNFLNIVGPDGIGLLKSIEWKPIPLSTSTVDVRTGGRILKRRKTRVLIVPVISGPRSRLSFNQLSEGTFRALALLYHLMTDRPGLLLVEEPEVCIHHGLLRSVIETVKAYSASKQIVLSTHSEILLDSVGPDNVFAVTNKATKGTTVRALSQSMSGRDFAALKEYLANDGNLGEYWSHGDMA
jgi:ABC-type lipoprotein export system ATPase subunit